MYLSHATSSSRGPTRENQPVATGWRNVRRSSSQDRAEPAARAPPCIGRAQLVQHRDGCGQVEPWHQRRHALHPARREGTSSDMDMEAYSMRCVSQGVSCKASGRGRGAPVQAVLGRTRRHGGGQPRRRSHGRSRNQGRSWGHGGRRREGVSGVDAWVAGADVDRERRGGGGARRRLAHRLRAPTSPWSASETGR